MGWNQGSRNVLKYYSMCLTVRSIRLWKYLLLEWTNLWVYQIMNNEIMLSLNIGLEWYDLRVLFWFSICTNSLASNEVLQGPDICNRRKKWKLNYVGVFLCFFKDLENCSGIANGQENWNKLLKHTLYFRADVFFCDLPKIGWLEVIKLIRRSKIFCRSP